jgi:hypothetical protein
VPTLVAGLNVAPKEEGVFLNKETPFGSSSKIFVNVLPFVPLCETWLGNNVSLFVHLRETWLGNNVYCFMHLREINMAGNNGVSCLSNFGKHG